MACVPHIYLSARLWLPKKSLTRQVLSKVFRHSDVIQNTEENWDAAVWERNIGQRLLCISFSPDDGSVTCGADDGRVYSWDPRSSASRGSPLAADTKHVSSIMEVDEEEEAVRSKAGEVVSKLKEVCVIPSTRRSSV